MVALFVIALLTQRGAVSLTTSLTDTLNNQRYLRNEQAVIAEEAGVAEVKARLRGSPSTNTSFIGDPSVNPNPLWSAYILTSPSWTPALDPDYNGTYTNYFPTLGSPTILAKTVNSLQRAIPYWVKVRHKREYDAELEGHTLGSPHYIDGDGSTATHTPANPGNILYYGYYPSGATTPVYFTSATSTSYLPVELIRAYLSGSNTLERIEIDAVHAVGPLVPAAVYAVNNVTVSGSSSVNGNDYCKNTAGLPPVYSMQSVSKKGGVKFSGNPNAPVQYGSLNIPLAQYVSPQSSTSLSAGADVVLTTSQNNAAYGSPSQFIRVYANPGPLGITLNNATGYGLLLVNGDLTMGGAFSWNGLILVTGTLTFNGGSNIINLNGAVLSDASVQSTGNITVDYNSCNVANALATGALAVKRWKHQS